jgi:hypothetical protein
MITGCGIGGRTIGRIGDIELNYCGHHRKYGERVLNFFAASVFGQELMEFLREVKQDLFFKNRPELCEHCALQIREYVSKHIEELDDLKAWHKKTKWSKSSKN